MKKANKDPVKLNAAQNLLSGLYNGSSIKYESDSRQKWEELEDIYVSCMETLIVANNSILELYGIPNILSFIQKENEVKVALNGLANDITHFGGRLKEIHDKHAGKSGPVQNEADQFVCFSIFEEYYAYQTHYVSVIMPTVMLLTDEAGLAVEAMKAYYAANPDMVTITDEQNPQVITDVEVKESLSIEPETNEIQTEELTTKEADNV